MSEMLPRTWGAELASGAVAGASRAAFPESAGRGRMLFRASSGLMKDFRMHALGHIANPCRSCLRRLLTTKRQGPSHPSAPDPCSISHRANQDRRPMPSWVTAIIAWGRPPYALGAHVPSSSHVQVCHYDIRPTDSPPANLRS